MTGSGKLAASVFFAGPNGRVWRNNHTDMEIRGCGRRPATVRPRLGRALLLVGSSLGWGRVLGVQNVFHRLCQDFGRRH